MSSMTDLATSAIATARTWYIALLDDPCRILVVILLRVQQQTVASPTASTLFAEITHAFSAILRARLALSIVVARQTLFTATTTDRLAPPLTLD